jgi:hypothetical protein
MRLLRNRPRVPPPPDRTRPHPGNSTPEDLSQEGPYGVVLMHDSLQVPRPGHHRPTRLALTVSAPAVAPAEPPLPGPPYPVVLLLNGFQVGWGGC